MIFDVSAKVFDAIITIVKLKKKHLCGTSLDSGMIVALKSNALNFILFSSTQ